MTAIVDLQRSLPNTPARVPPAVVATCLISVARWLKALGVDPETATTAIDGIADVVEGAVKAKTGDLLIFALTGQGLWVLASTDEAEQMGFLSMAEAEKAPVLGLNPALIDRAAHDIIASGGQTHAERPLH